MALTEDQQNALEYSRAVMEQEKTRENSLHSNLLQLEDRRVRLEAIRLAKETLIENARSKPVDSREVAVSDIQSFANTLVEFITK